LDFSMYRYRSTSGALVTGRYCPFGCDMHDWGGRWAENVGHGVALALMLGPTDAPPPSLAVDYDDGSDASWCAPLVPYSRHATDEHWRCLGAFPASPDDTAGLDAIDRWFERAAPGDDPPVALLATRPEPRATSPATGVPADSVAAFHALLAGHDYDAAGL